jgi:nitric oxide dioxygenase
VSTLLHESVNVGDVITMSLPYGDVVLDDGGRPVVFASAGIGIAPMAGMLSHLVAAASNLSITLWHADVDDGSFALRRQVVSDVLALRNASLHLWYERSDQTHEPVDGCNAGLMDLAHVRLPDNATYYMCGPLPFMQAVRSALIDRQVAPRDIQYEVFGPDLWQADFE